MNQQEDIFPKLSIIFRDLLENKTPSPLKLPDREHPHFLLCQQINQLIHKIETKSNLGKTKKHDDKDHLLQAIIQHAPYGIISVNQKGVINYCNQLASFMMNENKKDILTGVNLLLFLEERQVDTTILRQCLTPSQPNSQRTTITFPNEDDATSLSLTIVNYLNQPEEHHFVIFLEDLSGENTLADAIQFYTENLEWMVAEKSKEIQAMQSKLIANERAAAMVATAGGIAHELRQPLTAIIGTLELLGINNGNDTAAPIKKKLDMVMHQALRMAEIIKKMERLVEYQTRDYVNDTKILDLSESSQQKK